MEPHEFQEKVIEKLTRLETHMHELVGNGKPGRVKELEEKVEALSKWRWLITGSIIAASAAIHFIFKY